MMTLPFDHDMSIKLLGVTFHVQCKCGATWNMEKGIK
jgi:hypothetical protein